MVEGWGTDGSSRKEKLTFDVFHGEIGIRKG